MRFRDMKFHVFISIVLVTAYIFFAVFYFISTDGVVDASALSQAETFRDAKITSYETNIEHYRVLIQNGTETEEIKYIDTPVENYKELFADQNHLVSKLNIFIPDESETYYAFFYNETTVAYVPLEHIFSTYNDDETYYFYNEHGEIISTNEPNFSFQTIGSYFSDIDKLFKETKERLGKGYYVVTEFEGNWFTYKISGYGNTLNTEMLQNQTLLFFCGAFGVIICSFFVLLFGFKKASRLCLIDKHNYKKAKSIVLRINKRGKIIFMNQAFKSILKYGATPTTITELEAVGDIPLLHCIKKEINFIAKFKSNADTFYLNLVSIYSHRSYYLIGFDTTKQYINNEYLLKLLNKNTLTNLDNGLALAASFMDLLELSKSEFVSLALINIKGFREINKVFGRGVGDKILIAFSELLVRNFAGMHVYHMDADVFCVAFTDPKARVAQQMCNELMLTLKTPLLVQNNHIHVTTKMGIYHIDANNTPTLTLGEARAKLDISLKHAMNTATKDIIVYDFNIENLVEQSNRMEKDLLQAVEKGEFEMYFQPQYDIFANRIVSFEALIRWNNPLYFKLSPQVYIEMAEHNGYIVEVGKFVIQESLRMAKRLEPYDCHVSINVSPAQFLQAGFVSEIIAEFNKNNLKPGSIAIEITETFVMENFEIMLEKIISLKRQGFSIHLDDFGTGYSSLLYLKDLPVDIIKIDKEFTKHIETDKYSLTMVEHICNIGSDLGLDIICEGVETEKQSAILKKMGCRIIQGWLIGKALPIDKAIELIHKLNIEAPAAKKNAKTSKKG